MIETLFAQLSIAYSLWANKKFSVKALNQLVDGIKQNQQQFGTPALRIHTELEENYLSREEAETLLLSKFQKQATLAYQHTPFYRKHFAKAGILPQDIHTFADIAKIPITTKSDLQQYPDHFVNETISNTIRTMTTGTTGWPTYVHLSQYELSTIINIAATDFLIRRNANASDIVHIGYCTRATHINLGTGGALARLGATIYQVGQVLPQHALTLLAEQRHLKGKKEKSSILLSYPSYFAELVETGLQLGYTADDFGLERVIMGGEMVTQGMRERAKKLFGNSLDIFEGYALTEVVPFGATRTPDNNLYFEPSHGLLEVINPLTGQPSKKGELGTLIITPYLPYRETTLLLRYDTQDVVRFLHDPLTADNKNPATTNILGKMKHAVQHKDGWTFTRDVQEALDMIEDVPLPSRYMFCAYQDGVEVQVVVRNINTKTKQQIADALEAQKVPLTKLTLLEDPSHLSRAMPLRCDMREYTIGLHEQTQIN